MLTMVMVVTVLMVVFACCDISSSNQIAHQPTNSPTYPRGVEWQLLERIHGDENVAYSRVNRILHVVNTRNNKVT